MGYNRSMKTLAEKLRHEIEICGKSRYSISQSTGIEDMRQKSLFYFTEYRN